MVSWGAERSGTGTFKRVYLGYLTQERERLSKLFKWKSDLVVGLGENGSVKKEIRLALKRGGGTETLTASQTQPTPNVTLDFLFNPFPAEFHLSSGLDQNS